MTMKKKTKRILTLALCAILLAGMTPEGVLAAEPAESTEGIAGISGNDTAGEQVSDNKTVLDPGGEPDEAGDPEATVSENEPEETVSENETEVPDVCEPEETVSEDRPELPDLTGHEEAVSGNTRVTYKVPGGKLYFEPDTGTIAWADGDMEELTIPDKINETEVKLIGRWALSGLKKLKKIDLPKNKNILGEGSFAELVAIEEFAVPDGYETIPKQCFYGCTSLKKISMPASLTSIGEMAFYQCPALEYVDIPGNCASIGRMAFYSCTGLKGVAFVKGSCCDLSGWGIFYNCNSLEKVVNIPNKRFQMFYESGKRAEKWLDTDEMRANQTEMWRLKYGTESDRAAGSNWIEGGELTARQDAIRAKAQEITKNCTTDREKIEAVMNWIIDKLEYEKGHDNHPWAVYTGIQEVEAGTKSEQLNSCGGYSNMTQVLLQALGIPCATVWRKDLNGETIDHEFCAAYFEGKWRWLDTTHSDNRKEGLELDVSTAGFFANSDHRVDYLLYRSAKGEDIYKELPLDIPVVEDVKDWPNLNPADAYKLGEAAQDQDWKHEVDPADIQAEKDKIAQRAAEFPNIPVSSEDLFGFDDSTGTITSMKNYTVSMINIPKTIRGVTVKAIGDEAMKNMSKLEYLTMPDSITQIGKYAFANNYKLKRVHLSAGITELKEGILKNCSSLDSVTIPKNVKRLGPDLFSNCGSLEEALFEDYDFKIKVIETDPMGSDNYYNTGQADISWYCFAGGSGRALHGLDFHETYIGTKYYRQLQALDLTDDWRQNIVKIHQSQRGYREGFSPYHLDGSNSKPFKLSNKAVDYEWGHFAEASRFTGYQPATWCRAFIQWAYAMAGVEGYRSTEFKWDQTVYAGKGGTVELEPGDMLGMGKSHWCMVGSVKDLGDTLEMWIIHGNHGDRMVMDEVRHYDKKTGKATDMEDEDYDYFRAIYKIDFSGIEKQTVTLDAGEGTCDVKSRIYCKGAYYGCLPDAIREDYVFDGWYTQPDGKGKKAYPYRNLEDDVTTLYANYIYNPKAVKGVKLDKESVKLGLGKQLTLIATVQPADAENPAVTWRSGNDEVVSVDGGVIRGLKTGKATIMARTVSGPYVAYCEVEVTEDGAGGNEDPEEEQYTVIFLGPDGKQELYRENVKTGQTVSKVPPVSGDGEFAGWIDTLTGRVWDPTTPVTGNLTVKAKFIKNGDTEEEEEHTSGRDPGLHVKEGTIYLVKGQSVTLPASASGNAVVWKTSDKTKVSVSKKNVAKAVSVTGSTEVKLYDGDTPEKSSICYKVVVTDPYICRQADESMSKITKTQTVTEGSRIRLKIAGVTGMEEKYPVTWYSSKPETASVTDGTVAALCKGSAKITACINGRAYSCKVSVRDTTVLPKKIGSAITLMPLQSAALKSFADGFKVKNASWSSQSMNIIKSSNGKKILYYQDSVVRITPAGKITAVGKGETELKGTSADGKSETTLTVTVKDTPSRVIYLNAGKKKTVKHYNVKALKAEWSLDQTATAQEVSKGKLKGLKKGTAKYTCSYDPYETGGFTYLTTVYVEEPKLVGKSGWLELKNAAATKGELTMKPGSVYILTMEGIDRPVLFTSNKNTVAFADDSGVIHARSNGNAKLTATVNGVKFSVTVRVKLDE